MSTEHKPHSELRKRVERILGESGYMGYEGDIAEFWESVRDHGWGSVEDEAKTLIEDMRGVLTDLVEQKEALRTAVLARCFMCADGIARQDCEPFDMHNYTVSGLHSWRGNDRMFCGLTQQEAEAAGVSNPASEPKP